MVPYNIESAKEILKIILISKEMGFDMNSEGGIPIGYDDSCNDNNECKGYFKQLSINRLRLTSSIKEFNKITNGNSDSKTNGDLLLLTMGRLLQSNFKDANIMAMVCTYHLNMHFFNLTCKDNLNDIENKYDSFTMHNSSIAIQCPDNCLDQVQ